MKERKTYLNKFLLQTLIPVFRLWLVDEIEAREQHFCVVDFHQFFHSIILCALDEKYLHYIASPKPQLMWPKYVHVLIFSFRISLFKRRGRYTYFFFNLLHDLCGSLLYGNGLLLLIKYFYIFTVFCSLSLSSLQWLNLHVFE